MILPKLYGNILISNGKETFYKDIWLPNERV